MNLVAAVDGRRHRHRAGRLVCAVLARKPARHPGRVGLVRPHRLRKSRRRKIRVAVAVDRNRVEHIARRPHQLLRRHVRIPGADLHAVVARRSRQHRNPDRFTARNPRRRDRRHRRQHGRPKRLTTRHPGRRHTHRSGCQRCPAKRLRRGDARRRNRLRRPARRIVDAQLRRRRCAAVVCPVILPLAQRTVGVRVHQHNNRIARHPPRPIDDLLHGRRNIDAVFGIACDTRLRPHRTGRRARPHRSPQIAARRHQRPGIIRRLAAHVIPDDIRPGVIGRIGAQRERRRSDRRPLWNRHTREPARNAILVIVAVAAWLQQRTIRRYNRRSSDILATVIRNAAHLAIASGYRHLQRQHRHVLSPCYPSLTIDRRQLFLAPRNARR